MSNPVLDVVTSRKLTYEQKLFNLAHAAEDTLKVLHIPEEDQIYFDKGAVDDLFEGGAPYRPRYVMPDYSIFVKNGSEFLGLEPPKDLDELLFGLMILYRHVPSITSFPVYLGNIDKMIDPFLEGYSDDEIKKKLKLFLNYLDRTITDSFSHANLGPEDTRAGRLILEVEKDLQNAVPNLTLKYDPEVTSEEFAELAMYTSLFCANPAMANHKLLDGTYGEVEYGISSCYNVLPTQGGAYTLSRLVLPNISRMSENRKEFFEKHLPASLKAMGNYMNERVRFLVEESGFFESSFLVKEGLIKNENFIGMFGFAGVADAVNDLMEKEGLDARYGHDSIADDLAEEMLQAISDFANNFEAVHSPLTNGRFLLHAQVGMDYDVNVTSGVRITVGEEPENMSDHLRHSGRMHKLIPTGCSDIFAMESTARKNPKAMVDLVKGAFNVGSKYISFYEEDGDLVRITGYLVKRSEMEKYKNNQVVLQNTTQLGVPNYQNNNLADRKVRGV